MQSCSDSVQIQGIPVHADACTCTYTHIHIYTHKCVLNSSPGKLENLCHVGASQ